MKRIQILFAITALSLLIVSCNSPFSTPGTGSSSGSNVIIKIAGFNARTVLPNDDQLFSRYEVDLQKGIEPVQTIPDTAGIEGQGLVVPLSEGEWTITVRAYREIDGVNVLAAQDVKNFTVVSGNTPIYVAVELKPIAIAGSTEKGRFSFNIIMPDLQTGDTATLTLKQDDTAVSGIDGIDITNPAVNPGFFDLDAGYYSLSIILRKGSQSAGVAGAVHIYQGLESIADGVVDPEFDLTAIVFADRAFIAVELAGIRLGELAVYESNGTTRIGDVIPLALTTTDISTNHTRSSSYATRVPASYIGQNIVVEQKFNDYIVRETLALNEAGASVTLNLIPATPEYVNIAPWYSQVIASQSTAAQPAKNAVNGNRVSAVADQNQWRTTGNWPRTLTLDFAFPVSVNAAWIFSAGGSTSQVRGFTIDYFDAAANEWKIAHNENWRGTGQAPAGGTGFPAGNPGVPSGSERGDGLAVLFDEGMVTARSFRFTMTGGSQDQVSVWNFELYNAVDRQPLINALADADEYLDDAAEYSAADGTVIFSKGQWYTETVWNNLEQAAADAEAFTGLDISGSAPNWTIAGQTSANITAAGTALQSALTGLTGHTPRVVTPVIAPNTAEVLPGAYINLSTITQDAVIWYTVDESDPASGSSRIQYTAPFSINVTTTVKAVAVKDGWTASVMAERSYEVDTSSVTVIVTFNSAGGTAVTESIVEEGDLVDKPTDPVKAFASADEVHAAIPAEGAGLYRVTLPQNWYFAGWFTGGGVEWDFDADTVDDDMTLYARWNARIPGVASIPQAFTHIGNTANPDGSYILAVDANAAITAQTLNRSGVNLTLIGLGQERTIRISAAGRLFNVNGATLTLGNNITLTGLASGTNNNSLVNIDANGHFIMLDGSKITGHSFNTANGTVNIENTGIFTMKGGEITNNTTSGNQGGWVTPGIYREDTTTGRIYLEGGTITGNVASNRDNNDVFYGQNATGNGVRLYLSGNTTVGRFVAGNNTVLVIPSVFTGIITTAVARGTHADNKVFVEGIEGHTLTQGDLDRIQGGRPMGRWLQLRTTTNDAILLPSGTVHPALIVLQNAVTAAEENLTSVEISTDGTNVLIGVQWVTSAEMTTYQNAINDALTVSAANPLATVTAMSLAATALEAATTVFNNAKKPGTLAIAGPAFVSAQTVNDTGAAFSREIRLVFDKPLAGTANPADFTVMAGTTALTVDSAAINTTNVVLTLNEFTPVVAGDGAAVTVSFANSGGLTDVTVTDSLVMNFSSRPVTNNVTVTAAGPYIVRAAVDTANPNVIQVTFSEAVTNLDAGRFRVLVNNMPNGNQHPILTSGATQRAINTVSGSGTTWNMTMATSAQYAEILRLAADGGAAADLYRNSSPVIPQLIIQNLVPRTAQAFEDTPGLYINGNLHSTAANNQLLQAAMVHINGLAAAAKTNANWTIVLGEDQTYSPGAQYFQSGTFTNSRLIVTTVLEAGQRKPVTVTVSGASTITSRNALTFIFDGPITFNGAGNTAGSWFMVMDEGKMVLDGGVTIQNNNVTAANDGTGAIRLGGGSNAAYIIINNAIIRNNRQNSNATSAENTPVGGAIVISDYGVVVMHGGEISGNEATGTGNRPRAGAIVGAVHRTGRWHNTGVFITGGIIRNNSATGGGAYAAAGGILVGGSFQKTGGTIEGNTVTATGNVRANQIAVHTTVSASNNVNPPVANAVIRNAAADPGVQLITEPPSMTAVAGTTDIVYRIAPWLPSQWD